MWEEKFLVRARILGYRSILKGTTSVPKESDFIDESNEAGKVLKKSREANENTLEDLVISIEGDNKAGRVAFGVVKGYKIYDLQDRDARIFWTRLSNKFEFKTTSSLLKLKKDFTNSKSHNHDDPY